MENALSAINVFSGAEAPIFESGVVVSNQRFREPVRDLEPYPDETNHKAEVAIGVICLSQ